MYIRNSVKANNNNCSNKYNFSLFQIFYDSLNTFPLIFPFLAINISTRNHKAFFIGYLEVNSRLVLKKIVNKWWEGNRIHFENAFEYKTIKHMYLKADKFSNWRFLHFVIFDKKLCLFIYIFKLKINDAKKKIKEKHDFFPMNKE